MGWKATTLTMQLGLAKPIKTTAQCCGRHVSSDVLVDCTMQPAELRPRNEEHHCDGCRERIFALGLCTREEYYARHDPPAEFMATLRAHVAARDGVREA